MLSEKQVFVKDGTLNIQVSIDGIINGLRHSNGEYIISDKEKFEKWLSDNCVELGYEDSTGDTIWDELLDKIGERAYENGEEFICMAEDIESELNA